jgi:hypothetical protein
MARRTNIRQRGKSWVVHYRANGKQHWQSFKTKEEAELELARVPDSQGPGRVAAAADEDRL